MINLIQPKKPSHPLIVSVPHAGTFIPEHARDSFASLNKNLLKRDADLFVDKLYAAVPDLGGTLITTKICRYVIDPNRDKNAVNACFVQGSPAVDKPKNLGLVAHKTTKDEILLKHPLTRVELTERIERYYDPFYEKLAAAITQAKKQFGFCLHIDAHSMPSRGTGAHADEGAERPDICLADRTGTSCGAGFTKFLKDSFASHGLSVLANKPYQGGWIVQHFGRPHKDVHSIMIEINRKLYMDEKAQKKLPEKFRALAKILERVLKAVREWTP